MNREHYSKLLYYERMVEYGSILSVIWIFSYPTLINIIFCALLSFCATIGIVRGNISLGNIQELKKLSLKIQIIVTLIAVVFGVCFFNRWSNPDTTILVPNIVLKFSNSTIAMFAIILFIGSIPFFLRLVSQYNSSCDRSPIVREKTFEQKHSYMLYIFVVAVITITICSKSSILYPYNDAPDGNCFFTVGRSLIKGKVLYRDIFEQKGPYIYFLHAILSLVSERTFLGVYLCEIIAVFLFLCVIYKTVRLFNNDIPIGAVALFAAVVFSQGGFFHGDEIEELCLPVISLTNYYLLRYAKNKTQIQAKEMLLVGILAGCIFWSKYNICGYFVCWYAFVVSHQIMQHRMNCLAKCFFAGLGGVLLSTIPVFIYFASNNAAPFLWEGYFFTNLHNYNNVNTGSIVGFILNAGKNNFNGIWISLRYNLATCIFLICGAFGLRSCRERRLYAILIGATFFFTCTFINPQKYYVFLFAAFSAPGLVSIWDRLQQTVKIRKMSCFVFMVTSAITAFSLCPNTYMLKYKKEELPQYRFANTIKTSENATLLNYGFMDCGFYTVSEIVPSCRYFCKLNIEIPEANETQEYYVSHGVTDFVVCRDRVLESDYYVLCDSCTYYFENSYRTDYFYRLKQD